MKEDIIKDIKETIKNLKLEIIEKQEQLEELIQKYQELSGIKLDDEDCEVN